MTREERIAKIEAECKYTTERTSNLHFLLLEVKRLEAENRKAVSALCDKHSSVGQVVYTVCGYCQEALQKETSELRERLEALQAENEKLKTEVAQLRMLFGVSPKVNL